MKNELETRPRWQLAPVHYTVIGIVIAVLGFALRASTMSNGSLLLAFVMLIFGALLAVTGVIRGATRGWFHRGLE